MKYFTVTQELDFVSILLKCRAKPIRATRRRLCVNGASVVTGVFQKPVASSEWNSVRTFSSLRRTVRCLNYSSWCISVKSAGEIQSSSLLYMAYEKRVCGRCCGASGIYSTRRNKHIVSIELLQVPIKYRHVHSLFSVRMGLISGAPAQFSVNLRWASYKKIQQDAAVYQNFISYL